MTQASGSASCPVPGKTYNVGNPKGPTTSPPDLVSSAGDRFIDGESGATIKCSVKGSGPFTFSGTIQALSNPENDRVTLSISNWTINADKMTGTATISVNTPQLGGTFTSPPGGCTLTVFNQQVKPGSVWATAYCPTVNDPTTGKVCQVGQSVNSSTTFVLENCDGS